MNYRNKKILNFAKGQPCTMNVSDFTTGEVVCSNNPNTTVFAHLNEMFAGKGMGVKAHDFAGCFACQECHDWYDSNKGTIDDRRYFAFVGMVRTLKILFDNGIIK